MSQLNQLDSTY